ncbi:GNAT family N-acetyltransferase [Stenotrophomonas pavanii]|uniref:GNAT family N-acetyltransferase n=1 Tax=Stenotrophomonas pavanii TaxID=487698 RepID=UPI0039C71FF2
MAPPDPSLTTLHIREAMPADVPALIALDSVAAHDPRRARQISDWQASGGVHVAERAGQLAGYLVIHHHFFGEAFVEMLMVARGQRNQGVGAALLRHASRCRGKASCLLRRMLPIPACNACSPPRVSSTAASCMDWTRAIRNWSIASLRTDHRHRPHAQKSPRIAARAS